MTIQIFMLAVRQAMQCSVQTTHRNVWTLLPLHIFRLSRAEFLSSTSLTGFRTSHEIQKIEEWDYADLADMLDWDAVEAFRRRALNPEHPVTRGTAQNDDIFFQAREACNKYYDAVPEVVVEYMNKVNEKIGTNYKPFNYYGAEDAEHIIVAMGSVCDCAEEVVDFLNAAGEKVGLLKVHLYQTFRCRLSLKRAS